jgi:DNA repair exonuclease SbcCD nuclease subunit
MRFLHAADLHLGLRVTRFSKEVNDKVREARFRALDSVLTAARTQQVEMLIVAGDLFDDNHIEATTSRRAWEMLESLGMPVYVLPGNHDPLTPDSVWQRPPWNQAQGGLVQVARHPEPISARGDVALFPCPLFRKTSFDDPTAWIPRREPGDKSIRIGIAHGSLRDRDNLPADDHLIDRCVADERGLDYVALGHWHRPSRHLDRQGAIRTVYPGVHEPMRFPESAGFQIGWTPYSNAVGELFADDGRGRVVCVGLEGAGAEPVLKEIDVGYLQWSEEVHRLESEDDLSRLIRTLAERPNLERRLLRLRLEGIVSAKALVRLDELEDGVLRSYCWAELNADRLHGAPGDEELRSVVGSGVLRAVYHRLREEETSPDEGARQRAARSLLVLYRLAQEVRR